VSVPKADELFRPTAVPPGGAPPDGAQAPAKPRVVEPVQDPDDADEVGQPRAGGADRRHSGRVKHDEKMTVYITSDELLDLEHARLVLRRTLGSAVDRGRIVRAAVALALADLEQHGEQSALVRRLEQA
jgi:hypothetical protein